MPHQNEELIRRVFRALCARDMSTFRALVQDDVTLHYPGHSVLAGDHQGTEAVERWVRRHVADRNVHVTNVSAFADDERAVLLYVQDVTHGDETDHERCIAVFSFRDGKISQIWVTPQDLYASDELWRTGEARA